MDPCEIKRRLDFLRKAERLKDTIRSGFTTQGRPESVAEHTWRLTLLVITFADQLQNADILRLLKMCILHDLGEAIDGDVPAPLQDAAVAKSDKERSDFQQLLTSLPAHLQTEFLALWDGYEDAASHEARITKAFDKIETLLQHNQGRNPSDFDYLFNLEYGKRYTDAVPLGAQIRSLIDEDTAHNAGRQRDGQSS